MRSRSTGSSPLARGLRVGDDIGVGAVGIIPARAGFTNFDPLHRRGPGDHPRSRGVYSYTPSISIDWGGIIPARAGFTSTARSARSAMIGSSPLARGLRHLSGSALLPGRIIPARAGFTRPGRPVSGRPGDHPRSRGVYGRGDQSPVLRPGSSPLARGLLFFDPDYFSRDRIIPARAGFTFLRPRLFQSGPDHPRSRGVYFQWAAVTPARNGSSPLARGLPADRIIGPLRGGIIPARAGFTPHWPRYRHCVEDHPRSRGVYGRPETDMIRHWGSSPLARGLHELAKDLAHGRRIIPARAGFTPLDAAVVGAVQDHPRSRGVYGKTLVLNPAAYGSSPLARGLPGGPGNSTGKYGIIPARAGFTTLAVGASGMKRDHPRSRGVYRRDRRRR